MTEGLRLEYLGGMQVARGGTPLTGFVSVKAPALLCYLAVTGRPQFRLVLAGLLWGDLPEADASANLRKVLSNLRDLVGDHLVITPHTVAFDRGSAHWLDVGAFLERVDRETRKRVDKETGRQGASHHPLGSLSTSPLSTDLPCLIEAADLYRGDFLDGFYVRHALAFEEWVLGQRERLRQVAAQVFQTLSSYYSEHRELAPALDYTSRLLALDPWREEAHRQMMALLAQSGQRSMALAQFETCRRLLKSELDVEPAAETTALYRRIRGRAAPRPHNLPSPATSFVGRQVELAQLARGLADPQRRLLTILGHGGVGKSRLALQAALAAKDRDDDAFPDGIYFVSLDDASTRSGLAAALAAAVGATPGPGADPEFELAHHLRRKELLLVLDGFERLAGASDFLSALLQYAPQIKLLVTSRQRLNLAGEWPLELAGLPNASLGTAEEIERFDAIQLFLQRAQQACPDLQPSAMDYQAIAYICQMVEGLPLAIELAAAWGKCLSCLEIAQAVESSLDALTAFMRDSPPRHQSMRASLEHSWNLLSPREKQILRRLSVFRGGFDREAAAQVTDADLPLLTALTDKSLLRRDPAGRYVMHGLLRQFACEKLDAAPADSLDIAGRHAWRYLVEFLPQREAELRGGRQREALDRFRAEIGNVRAAWVWAAEHGMSEAISHALLPLAILCEMLGWWGEGEAAFGAAVDGLRAHARRTDSADMGTGVILGALLAAHGSFCLRVGDPDRAAVQLQAGRDFLASAPDSCREKAFPHLGLGLLACHNGQPADAEDHYRRGLAIVRQAGDALLTASSLDYLGEICGTLGKTAEAQQLLQESLALHRDHNEQWGIGRALFGLGQVAVRLGKYAEARAWFGEALAAFEALAARAAAARVTEALGELALATGAIAETPAGCQSTRTGRSA